MVLVKYFWLSLDQSRNKKKKWNLLLIRLFVYLRFSAGASKLFLRYRGGIFLYTLKLQAAAKILCE